MPGIVGVVATEDADPLPSTLEAMIRPMLFREWYRVQRRIGSHAALASISLDAEQALAEVDTSVLALFGEVADQSALRGRLLASGDSKACEYGLSEVLLRLYLKEGVDALCGLNGLYVICVWEETSRRLTIVNDRYGFQKCYYWMAPGRLLFASEYKAIAQHPRFNRRIDEAALADILSVSYPLDNRTLFGDVKLVPQASVMIYQDGKLSVRQYWDYLFERKPLKESRLSDDAWADGYYEVLRRAVRRRARGETCIPLTGGLDSRSLAAIVKQCAPHIGISTITIGHAHSYDVRFARQIARALGYPHAFLPVGSDYFARYAAEGVRRLEGEASCFSSWVLAQDAFLERHGIRYTMNGFLGGAFVGADPLPPAMQGVSLDDQPSLLYRIKYNHVFGEDGLANLLRPSVYRNTRGVSLAAIRRSYLQAPAEDALARMQYVDLDQRQRRFISTHLGVAGALARSLDPLADNDVVDYSLRIPVELGVGRELYKRVIIKHIPAVARVPYVRTGLPLDIRGIRHDRRYMPQRLWRYVHRSALPRLGLRLKTHDLSAYVHYDEWLRKGARDFVMSVLSRGEYLEDYVQMDAVERVVSDHMAGKGDHFQKICALMTFAIWREQFC